MPTDALLTPAGEPTDDLAPRREQLRTAIRQSKEAIKGGDARVDTAAAPLQSVGRINATAVAFNVFAKLLQTDGIRSALYSLLRLTDYRFISIFRFKGGMATSAVHVDREDLNADQAPEVIETATYCLYVRNADGAFVTADAQRDPRTDGHVAREVVRAYCGIPISDASGELIGTLCHYDLVPRDPAQLDVELLTHAASVLAASGLIPAYPGAA